MDRPQTTPTPQKRRTQRACHPQNVPLGEITPSPRAQREFDSGWAAKLAADFNLEGMGHVTLNKRDGHYYCCDGQHRLAALKLLGFADDDAVSCDVYEGLSEVEEADLFLDLNNHKSVTSFDKFRVGVYANRDEETAIVRYVKAQGLNVSRGGGISCVHALRIAYRLQGPSGFSKTLRIIRDSFGDAGFTTQILGGLSLFSHRYDGNIDEARAIAQLSAVRGGVAGFYGLASKERATTGNSISQCIAAVATLSYNKAKGPKLPSWWKS